MSEKFDYKEYVTDESFLRDYNAYQAKYAKQMRESDKVLVGIIRDVLKSRDESASRAKLLDIGCSTGNLLLHLKRLLPDVELVGGDLAESSLAECRANAELKGISFQTLNILELPKAIRYDVIVVNAVLYMMEDEQFRLAAKSMADALNPGGHVVIFDFFHPFEQDLSIIESSKTHPNGLRLRFRPMSLATQMLTAAGLGNPQFRPFTLPIDLPRNPDNSELISYTVDTRDGTRLPFRGTLFQPWCHLSAQKT
jgi:SAM-dependent methyltransferase